MRAASLTRRIFAAITITLAMGGALGCAGYQLGHQTLYRPDVRTVHVPTIRSDSFRRGLGERLTEAVVRQIEKVTPYKVVADPEADSTLQIRLVSDSKRVLLENRFDDVRDVEVDFFLQASWIDRRGDLLAADPQGMPLPPAIANLGEHVNFVPEAGQSMATAQQEIIDRLAAQIVGMMEAPW